MSSKISGTRDSLHALLTPSRKPGSGREQRCSGSASTVNASAASRKRFPGVAVTLHLIFSPAGRPACRPAIRSMPNGALASNESSSRSDTRGRTPRLAPRAEWRMMKRTGLTVRGCVSQEPATVGSYPATDAKPDDDVEERILYVELRPTDGNCRQRNPQLRHAVVRFVSVSRPAKRSMLCRPPHEARSAPAQTTSRPGGNWFDSYLAIPRAAA